MDIEIIIKENRTRVKYFEPNWPFDREVNGPQFNQKAGRIYFIYFIYLYILPHRIDITESKSKSITKTANLQLQKWFKIKCNIKWLNFCNRKSGEEAQ